MPDVKYPASEGQLRGYLSAPSGEGEWPGVVVIHEAFGLLDDIRVATDRIAAQGYVAFAPDLYSYGFAPRCLLTTFRTMIRGGGGRALEDIDAARDYVLAQPQCTGKVGIIGFCMGGGFAILAATRGFDVAAPNYGAVPRDAERALEGACPIVGSYGAKDAGFKGAAAKLERACEANGIPHDIKEYPDAGHAFMTHHTGRWAFVERVPNMGYVEDAYDDGWKRVFAYFSTHLN